MKKLLILSIMPILLASCKSNNTDYKKWSIVTPTGAPAIAMSYFSGFENFQTNSDPTNVVAMMNAGNADIAVLPTNTGIQAIRQGNLHYKIARTITHGNVYVASTGNDDDGTMGPDDYIVSFQQGSVPDKIFHYVYDNALDNALHYVSNAQEAAKCLKLGKNLADNGESVDYVVLAEPALTNVLETTPKAKQYADLQELYKTKSGGIGIYQAAIFVKKTLDLHTLMEPVLGQLGKTILEIKNDSNKVIEYMNQISNPEATFGVKPEVAKKMFENGNRMNIDCLNINKDINLFLSLFGLEELRNEEII